MLFASRNRAVYVAGVRQVTSTLPLHPEPRRQCRRRTSPRSATQRRGTGSERMIFEIWIKDVGGSMHAEQIVALAAVGVLVAACGSKGEAGTGGSGDTLTMGASLSLTGSLAREGLLTKEGYQVCQQVV